MTTDPLEPLKTYLAKLRGDIEHLREVVRTSGGENQAALASYRTLLAVRWELEVVLERSRENERRRRGERLSQ